jgi:hypothetical protein
MCSHYLIEPVALSQRQAASSPRARRDMYESERVLVRCRHWPAVRFYHVGRLILPLFFDFRIFKIGNLFSESCQFFGSP